MLSNQYSTAGSTQSDHDLHQLKVTWINDTYMEDLHADNHKINLENKRTIKSQ